MKIMTIVGTRPEVIKLSRVIAELQCHVQHILVHTGQNHDYELNQIFFKQLKLTKPDYFLGIVGSTTAETIGNVISKSDDIMAKERPHALLLLGDTNSCLSAISAKRRKIPIFHMEAGNRCFDQTVPEEINRKIVDHISDINLPYTEHARRYLIAEGIKPETIIKTGSPMKEILEYYKADIEASDILKRLKLQPTRYFVVSAHREENVDSDTNFNDLLYSLNTIAETYDMPVIISTHPRTRNRLDSPQISCELDKRIRLLKPLGFPDYVCLQTNAFCVVSDSGTITEESSIMNFPAVTIRQAHERPEGMDEGTVIMCGLKSERVLQSIEVVTKQFEHNVRTFRLVSDYESENVSRKVVRIIISYTDYVNRTVWHEYA
ncbi:MAG: UDP-N-acetylglucosamine 2-epimerase (non-hydrolyzing) [Bacteroidetes bacterium]|nr:UDP-N-acetylglucosamine 2-epimerase (non-hydrolyzing) [Bacteroidota bacterium]